MRLNLEPEPDYLSARRTWNSAVERAFSSARHYQILSLVLGLGLSGSIAGLVWMGSQNRFIPYVVETDKIGESRAVQVANVAKPITPDEVRSAVMNFVLLTREVMADPVFEQDCILKAFTYLKSKDKSDAFLRDWWDPAGKRDPVVRGASETVAVNVLTAINQGGETWQVDWQETVRDHDGSLKEPVSTWRALLTVYTAPLDAGRTLTEIQQNPRGIYISEFHWSKLK